MSPADSGIHYVKANRETAFTDRGQQILATTHTTDRMCWPCCVWPRNAIPGALLCKVRSSGRPGPSGVPGRTGSVLKAGIRVDDPALECGGTGPCSRPSGRANPATWTSPSGRPCLRTGRNSVVMKRNGNRNYRRTLMHAGWQKNSSGPGCNTSLIGLAAGSPTIQMTRQRRRLLGKRNGAWKRSGMAS